MSKSTRILARQIVIEFSNTLDIEQIFNESDPAKLPGLLELKYHGLYDAKQHLGDVPKIREAFTGFQRYLYLES